MGTTRPRAWNSTLPPRREPMARTGLARNRDGGAKPARRTAARDTGPSLKTRMLVLKRDGYACVCCGISILGRPYSLQHRKRRSQGGGNGASNLITVLGTGTTGCHQRIDSRTDPRDEAKGYSVRSWDDPAEIGVMVFDRPDGPGVTYWLTGDGRRITEDERTEAA